MKHTKLHIALFLFISTTFPLFPQVNISRAWVADRGDGTYGGTFELETQGAPIETRGRTLLEADGEDRTRYEVTIDLKVKVPLIGGKIADFSKGIIQRQMADEFRLGDEWLASH